MSRGRTAPNASRMIFGDGVWARNVIAQPDVNGNRNSKAQPNACASGRNETIVSPGLERHVRLREDDVREEAPVREHHALGEAGRPRRVDDRREPAVLDVRRAGRAPGREARGRAAARAADVEALRDALLPRSERSRKSASENTAVTPRSCAASSGAKRASATKKRTASEWFTMWWTSSGRKSGRIGTITAPYVTVASQTTAQFAEFRPRSAILSPGATWQARKTSCSRAISSATCPYVRPVPPSREARGASSSAARSRR